jgi:hypothetical protein
MQTLVSPSTPDPVRAYANLLSCSPPSITRSFLVLVASPYRHPHYLSLLCYHAENEATCQEEMDGEDMSGKHRERNSVSPSRRP